MYKITGLTSDPLQKQKILLNDGTVVNLTIYFRPMQLGWFINEISYDDFVLNGVRIVNSPNILHQFRNQIPFGLACLTAGNREPSLQEDFSSGNSILYILDSTETAYLAQVLSGKV